ncbi:hypothetical protein CUMW_247460 [Citrus unshiu]|uniref:Uncharacterized protein n=1 Tax=Citrus unshiu TaxID=55188 RepID=A0A2H5QNS6_CITUN|nr:hypothetical protein CUMW_247460 [Citrus unshiu]
MEISSSVASKLGELLVEATINQARYLLCFNSIINELKDKETNLKEAKDGINEKIEQERQIHRAIVIEKDVEKWLKDVDKEMADVRNLNAKIDEKKSCLNGWCPNWGWQYWLGRKHQRRLASCPNYKIVANSAQSPFLNLYHQTKNCICQDILCLSGLQNRLAIRLLKH